jgi:predicted deacetylase
MKRRTKKIVKAVCITILALLFLLFLIRLITPTEIDDITPGILCPEIEKYNPDILYVIPNYENNFISNNSDWCDYILSLNKTLALHGINHTYREFLYKNITQEELEYSISEFELCFNKSPEMFKPPQLKINEENKQLIKNNNLKLRNNFNQITHKVYHCNDSDKISNNIIRIF